MELEDVELVRHALSSSNKLWKAIGEALTKLSY